MRRGVRLAIDVGKVRAGVARRDPDGILATPLVTLARDGTEETDLPSDMSEISRLITEFEAVEVVLGLPVNLSGLEGPAAIHVRAYAEKLANVIAPVPVVLSDERMSTVAATRRLSDRGVKGRRQRAVVDQAAAVEILQSWLDSQRRRR
jgi:putative Holliday junction resolvase